MNRTSEKHLIYAAAIGDLNEAIRLSNGSCDINKTYSNITALEYADIVQVLLEKEAKTFRENHSALPLAASLGKLNIVNTLLETDVNIEHTTSNNSTALTLAAHNGNCELVEKLLQAGANIESVYAAKGNYTPLTIAVNEGNVETVKLLLSFKANI